MNVASVSAGSYAAILTSIVTNIVVARMLGTTEYGRLALMIMASQVLLTLGASWTLPALIRYGAQEHAVHRSVSASLRARSGIMVPAVGLLLAILWLGRGPVGAYLDVPEAGVAILALHVVAVSLSQTVGGILQAAGRMALYGLTLFADKLLILGVVVAVAAFLPIDAVRVLAASALASLAVVFAGGVVLARLGLLGGAPAGGATIGELLRFSLPQIGGSWAGLFGGQWIDYVIIRRYLTLADLGVYALAFQIAGAVQQLSIGAATVLMPRYSAMAARGEDAEIRLVLQRIVPAGLLAFSLGLGILILSAGLIVPAIFGERFAGAVPPLLILLVASMAVGVFNAMNPALTAYSVVWPVTLAVALAVALNIVLDLVLIPSHGIVGAAVATALSYALSASIVLAVAARRVGVDVLGYSLFALPVLAAYVPLVMLDGALAYAVALSLGAASVILIAARFRMFARALPIDSAARSE